MAEKKKIIIYNFTDPVCTWCLGMEPIFRKIEVAYPENVEIRFIMGGLVKDYREMRDYAAGIMSGDAKIFNKQVSKHWLEAGKSHGMPVNIQNFALFSEEYPSTFPQNIAYKAALMSDPKKANLFLYNMRTAVAAEGKIISKEEVQVEIAEETGLNLEKFQRYLRDGSAEMAFEEDLMTMKKFKVRGFPSFIFERNGVHYALHGYSTFPVFERAINVITEGKLLPRAIERNLEVLKNILYNHPKIAAEEIRGIFDFNNHEEVRDFIRPLLDTGFVSLKEAGSSWFVLTEKESKKAE